MTQTKPEKRIQPQTNHSKKRKPYRVPCVCGGLKAPRASRCARCHIRENRPPINDAVFYVEGEPCRKIPITRGAYAVVDADLYEWLMQRDWHAVNSPSGLYAVSHTNSKGVKLGFKIVPMHVEIMGSRSAKFVDHKNGNTLDDRRSNLRKSTSSQSAMNRRMRSDNSSGYKGVVWHGYNWRVMITVRKRKITVGMFKDVVEAAKAYDRAALKYHGEFASLNFPLVGYRHARKSLDICGELHDS
jgi:hypothetical protein